MPPSIMTLYQDSDWYYITMKQIIQSSATVFEIINPTNDDMERLTIYEIKIQLFWDQQDPSHANN